MIEVYVIAYDGNYFPSLPLHCGHHCWEMFLSPRFLPTASSQLAIASDLAMLSNDVVILIIIIKLFL